MRIKDLKEGDLWKVDTSEELKEIIALPVFPLIRNCIMLTDGIVVYLRDNSVLHFQGYRTPKKQFARPATPEEIEQHRAKQLKKRLL